MDLSYLIEHKNQVIIDNELLNQHQKNTLRNGQPESPESPPHYSSSNQLDPELNNNNRRQNSPKILNQGRQRKISPRMTNLSPNNPNYKPFKKANNALVKKQFPAARESSPLDAKFGSDSQHRPEQNSTGPTLSSTSSTTVGSSGLSESQLYELLTARVEQIKKSQKEMEQKYQVSVNNLRKEITRCNEEYEGHCGEFQRVREELTKTKKDIASLISMLKNGKEMPVEPANPKAYSPNNYTSGKTQTKRGSPMPIKTNTTVKLGLNVKANMVVEKSPRNHYKTSVLSNFTKLSPISRDL